MTAILAFMANINCSINIFMEFNFISEYFNWRLGAGSVMLALPDVASGDEGHGEAG